MDKVRVGIVGLGWGQMHLAAFKRVKGAQVVALCDSDSERLAQVGNSSGVLDLVPNFTDLVTRSDIDLVCIASPTELHCEMAKAALEQGKGVICEKPLALDLQQAQVLVTAAQKNVKANAVGFEMRYLPSFAYAKELIDEDYLGRLLYANITMVTAQPWGAHGNWAADEARGGGLLMELGSHFFDALLWWFGEIETVMAVRETLFPDIKLLPSRESPGESVRRIRSTADDSFTALLRMEKGGLGVLSFVSGARYDPGWTVSLHGTRGTLLVSTGALSGTRDGEGGVGRLEIPRRLELPDKPRDPLLWGLARLVETVVAQMQGEHVESPAPDFEQGLAVQRVIQAIKRSSDDMLWTAV